MTVIDNADNQLNTEVFPNAIVVAVDYGQTKDFEYQLFEMKSLVEACEMKVTDVIVQSLSAPNPATYLGKGKLEELSLYIASNDIEYCIFLDILSPSQLKNIADEVSAVVLDRTGLILEIFSKRARTREARLQVESAKLQYMLPRLIGMRTSLGRQGGASGSMSNKGQGETQLELDRRHIEKKISELNRELSTIEHDREVQRARRNKSTLPSVALVGYTNAGKSTLMNRLCDISGHPEEKKVFEKDMLFATLDTTIRHIYNKDKKDFLLSDTVGFVSNLPHGLIKAFRSTLEEVKFADLLLIVLDASDEHIYEQLEVTESTLRELKCSEIPKLYVLNKTDKGNLFAFPKRRDIESIKVSAYTGDGIDDLLKAVKDILYSDNKVVQMIIPYNKGNVLGIVNEYANIVETEYLPDGTKIIADCPAWLLGKLQEVQVEFYTD